MNVNANETGRKTRRTFWRNVGIAICLSLVTATAVAQYGGRRGRAPNREDYPLWDETPGFEKDEFTFVRIRYNGGGWANDFPDADWNFSYRLQQLTSFKVDPDGLILELTDPELFNYPFIFMSNVQGMYLSREEISALRTYLLRGGFLMADDFWTKRAWRHVKSQMKEVFPNREPVELTLDHKIFHMVYDLKEIPRIPSIKAWEQGHMFEYWHGDPQGDPDPHYYGYFDDDGRMMAIFCHQADVGDGFEREGENREYFEKFSVKVSYPFGINIVTYAMTH